MKRNILFFVVIFLPAVLSAQEKDKQAFIHRGLLRAMGTISEGAMFSQAATNIYLHGNIEYYISDNVSLRGDGFYFVSTIGDVMPFKFHHAVFSGADFHFKTKNHFDPYIGIAPGISVTSMFLPPYYTIDPSGTQVKNVAGATAVDPLASGVIGVNLYFPKIFHLFIETRYIYGTPLTADAFSQSLSELRFSFGLGLNFDVLKKK